MIGEIESLRHLELMALNTAQTAPAARKVNECVALLTASLTTPPARTYAEGVEPEPFAYFQRNEGWDMWEQVAHEHRHEEGVVPAYRAPPASLATSRSQHEGAGR